MKEFNLERALAGDPVVTKGGLPVEELHYFKTEKLTHRLVAVIEGAIWTYDEKGRFHDVPDIVDLFMAPVKRQEWANAYQDEGKYTLALSTYPSYAEAYEGRYGDKYVNTVLIREWEE